MTLFSRQSQLGTLLLAAWFAVSSCAAKADDDQYRISIGANYRGFEALRDLVIASYADIGVSAVLVELPAYRSLANVVNGQVDATLFRTRELGDRFEDLIRVPIPIAQVDGVLFRLKHAEDRKYAQHMSIDTVAVPMGLQGLIDQLPPLRLIATTDPAALLDLVERRRVDYVYLPSTTLKSDLFRKFQHHLVELDRQEYLMYHYVHKRHAGLVDDLANRFKARQQGKIPAF